MEDGCLAEFRGSLRFLLAQGKQKLEVHLICNFILNRILSNSVLFLFINLAHLSEHLIKL